MSMIRSSAVCLLLVCFSVSLWAQSPGSERIRLYAVASALENPVEVTHAGDSRLFVLEQKGRIMVVKGGRVLPEPFIDLTSQVSCCGERGLLGLAFPPDHRETGHFFVNFTGAGGDTVIARFTITQDSPDVADIGSQRVVLTIPQPFQNHNGGQLRFGPDGMLWIGMGDGGSGGDPMNNGQSLLTLLGKILRIDVSQLPYAIPSDNPFVGLANARPEIWSYGWRNPWRFSFDRLTDDLFVGDVGQRDWEEIDHEPPGPGGRNYGWRVMEGNHCFQPPTGCSTQGLVLPIIEYDHSQGCSVTAGFRYRGSAIPALNGAYIYGDFCFGTIWRGDETGGEWTSSVLMQTPLLISAFGEDVEGELYVADYRDGVIYRIETERQRRRAARRP